MKLLLLAVVVRNDSGELAVLWCFMPRGLSGKEKEGRKERREGGKEGRLATGSLEQERI